MEIPKQVKIKGRLVNVRESSRGYIMVGNSYEEMKRKTKEKLNELEGNEHIIKWQKEMYNLFEKCLKKERKNE